MTRDLRAGLVQQRCRSNKEANLDAAEAAVRNAAAQGAQLAVLQELHAGPYFCQMENPRAFDLAEPIPGPSSERLARIARENGVVLVGSLFERRAAGLHHNTAVVFGPDGSQLGMYRKMHIPDDPGYYEKFYFAPGDLGFTPVDTPVGRLGVLVCWDQWFPEAARLMALAGAELLLYPTAIGWDPDEPPDERARQRDAWMLTQRAHAVANGLPVVAVNRVGHEPAPEGPSGSGGIQFWGSSFAAGPQGEIVHVAPDDREETAVVTLDLARSETVRRIWPFLRDRRIDAYGGLLKRYLD